MWASIWHYEKTLGLHPYFTQRIAKSKWRNEPDHALLQLYADEKYTGLWKDDGNYPQLETKLSKDSLCI